jgi:23S rRNA (adenine2503-C2)-methyltransferase
VREQSATDGVKKWLFRLADGLQIETVFIPEEDRGTLCLSTQVGCPMRCTFCATGAAGFSRHLTTAEILGQLWRVYWDRQSPDEPRAITNVVLMGMGEPLLNLSEVVPALRVMLDDFAYGFSRRRVTVSTVGIVPGIDALAQHCGVSLAVSLHATEDALRNELIPVNRRYPIAALLAACQRYVKSQPRSRITFEYVLLAGINDSAADARRLGRLLSAVPAKINLIPFNPYPGSCYTPPSEEGVLRFQSLLMEKGYTTIVRRARGQDIAAACGQLAGHQQAA